MTLLHKYTREDIRRIAFALGKPKSSGNGYSCCCPSHEDIKPSLSIALGHDGLLLLYCFAECTFENILQSMRDKRLLPSSRNLHYEDSFNRCAKSLEKSTTNLSFIRKIWNECSSSKNSIVEKYLNARGYIGNVPISLRCHPNLYHCESQSHYPAMVAIVVRWPENDLMAIHRTYLCGSDKADIEPNKKMLGSTLGGAVRLSEPGPRLIIAEGIETGLSVQLATGLPVWAALSATGMQNVIVPPLNITQEVIIAADNDKTGRNAAYELANRLLTDGYKVRLSLPPEGMDFNDMLRSTE